MNRIEGAPGGVRIPLKKLDEDFLKTRSSMLLDSIAREVEFSGRILKGRVSVGAEVDDMEVAVTDLTERRAHGLCVLNGETMEVRGSFFRGLNMRSIIQTAAGPYVGRSLNQKTNGYGAVSSVALGSELKGMFQEGVLLQGSWMDRANTRYSGPVVNGFLEGYGEKVDPQGNCFIGIFERGIPTAASVYHNNRHLYQGQIKDHLPHGWGTKWDTEGRLLARGYFQNGILARTLNCENCPERIYITPQGEFLYKGFVVENKRQGQAEVWTSDRSTCVYSGWFENDALIFGRINCPNNMYYSGSIQNDLPHGFGCMYRYQDPDFRMEGNFVQGKLVEGELFENGTMRRGKFCDGLLEGQGKIRYPSGIVYLGELHQSQKHGHGVLLRPDGTILYEGNFKHDLYDGPGFVQGPKPNADSIISEGEARFYCGDVDAATGNLYGYSYPASVETLGYCPNMFSITHGVFKGVSCVIK